MNLIKLFDMQYELDQHIINEHPELKGQDLLSKKILALLVELGECANEWRGFKFWSKNQEHRNNAIKICGVCGGSGTPIGIPVETGIDCWNCDDSSGEIEYNPLLEEYVDCLHFLLSIGLEEDILFSQEITPIKESDVNEQFLKVFYYASALIDDFSFYQDTWDYFIPLGEMLGFTWEEIEQAYINKNKVNHERQENGY